MPQLDVETFPSQLFWLAVTFVVLYFLMSWIGLPRVAAAIDARRQRREDDLARAAQLKSEAEAANAAFQRTMAEARAEAQAAIKETTDRLAAEAAERQRALAAALAQQIDEAERRIAETKQQALSEVRGIAADVGRRSSKSSPGRRRSSAAGVGGRQRTRGTSAIMSDLLHDHHFWVLISMVILIALVWKPASRAITSALDERAVRIRNELDEARRLRDEASSCSPTIDARNAKRWRRRRPSSPMPGRKPSGSRRRRRAISNNPWRAASVSPRSASPRPRPAPPPKSAPPRSIPRSPRRARSSRRKSMSAAAAR